jgi:hypothetical protein
MARAASVTRKTGTNARQMRFDEASMRLAAW